MNNKDIIPEILNCKKGDGQAFMKIYEVFERLIKYYNAKMCCEDGVQELTLFLLELLHRLDLSQFGIDDSFSVQKYIAVAIRNRYIDISKKGREEKQKTLPLMEAGALDEYRDEKIVLIQVFSLLTKKQKAVIKYKYFYGYSDAEIAKMMRTTRQAVNGIKRRAFNIIKNFIPK